jgi:hypothetical protein
MAQRSGTGNPDIHVPNYIYRQEVFISATENTREENIANGNVIRDNVNFRFMELVMAPLTVSESHS